MTIQQALDTLTAHQKRLAAYEHAMGIIYYDGATTAPRGTGANRGETMGVLSQEIYTISTSQEISDILDFLHDNAASLTPAQNRTVELLRRDFVETRAVPMEEYVAYQRLVNESEDVWHRAKENDDYPLFAPYIDRIVAAQKSIAHHVKPEANPYDWRLNRYEEGLTRETCDRFFDTLREGLTPLIRATQSAQQIDDGCLWGQFPLDRQRALSDYLMQVMGLDREHVGIGETEHPFTTSFSRYDVRITTHYMENNFASSMYSVIHEGGHALYEANTAQEYAYTALGQASSMAIHESQSRFYENIIGRSQAFIQLIYPKLTELFPSLGGVSPQVLYRAVNKAQPSLIRTEADELTYSMHIMVRYELEKRLFTGDITSADLPAAWAEMMQKYLGIAVPTNREGVLQDTHWSGGLFGYFPSYALGSAYGAQMLSAMQKDVDVFTSIEKGDFEPVNEWLKSRIWRHGTLYKPGELLENAVGAPFDPRYYLNYLTGKFTSLYNL